jgi:hypothetical protein
VWRVGNALVSLEDKQLIGAEAVLIGRNTKPNRSYASKKIFS